MKIVSRDMTMTDLSGEKDAAHIRRISKGMSRFKLQIDG